MRATAVAVIVSLASLWVAIGSENANGRSLDPVRVDKCPVPPVPYSE